MEITLEAIISLVGLFVGGGGGAFFMWRWQRKKAKAEAESAEAEAAKEKQDYYQQLIDDIAKDREDRKHQNDELRAERDHYKRERNELRDRLEKMEKSLHDMRTEYLKEKTETDLKIARLGRKVDMMRPFLCGDMGCKRRQLVAILDGEEPENDKSAETKDIEPLNMKDL